MCVLANEGTIAPFECLVFTNFDANEIQQAYKNRGRLKHKGKCGFPTKI